MLNYYAEGVNRLYSDKYLLLVSISRVFIVSSSLNKKGC